MGLSRPRTQELCLQASSLPKKRCSCHSMLWKNARKNVIRRYVKEVADEKAPGRSSESYKLVEFNPKERAKECGICDVF